MRHPSPLIYPVAFGAPVVFGVLHAIQLWRTSSSDTSTAFLVLQTVFAAIAPLAITLIAMGVFVMIVIYLEDLRPGNPVLITGGDHAGKKAVITQRHGFGTRGWVHVHLPADDLDTTISPYQIQKVGWRSRLF